MKHTNPGFRENRVVLLILWQVLKASLEVIQDVRPNMWGNYLFLQCMPCMFSLSHTYTQIMSGKMRKVEEALPHEAPSKRSQHRNRKRVKSINTLHDSTTFTQFLFFEDTCCHSPACLCWRSRPWFLYLQILTTENMKGISKSRLRERAAVRKGLAVDSFQYL